MLQTIERNIYQGMQCRNVTAITDEIKNQKKDKELEDKFKDEMYKKQYNR